MNNQRILDAQTNILHSLQRTYGLDNQLILVAEQKSRAQDQFFDTVSNTITAGNQVFETLNKLSVEFECVRNRKKSSKKTNCHETVKKLNLLLEKLSNCSEAILGPVQYPIERMEECCKVAREIQSVSLELKGLLSKFDVSLDEETTDELQKLWKEIAKEQNSISKLVNSFPSLMKKDYKLEAIQGSVNNLTTGISAGRNRKN